MCLAIPMKILACNDDHMAHAGFAIEVVDEQYAQETLDLIKEFPELAGEDGLLQ